MRSREEQKAKRREDNRGEGENGRGIQSTDEKGEEQKRNEERRTRKYIGEEKMYVAWVTTEEYDEWRWWQYSK